MNYSLLMFLFSLIAFACSKEDGEVNPTSTLRSSSSSNVMIGASGFDLGCLEQSGGQWSFTIGAGARHGLSNLQLELLECPEEEGGNPTTVVLGPGGVTIDEAYVMIQGLRHDLTPIYNADGSCVSIKGTDFTSFVKFEFDGSIDDLLKNFGGTLYFVLSDEDVVLYGANVIVKTGGKDNKCYRGQIKNCAGCETVPPREVCSFSQGRYFNAGGGKGGAGWGTVEVGNTTLTEGVDMLPATTAERRALFQAATLILSAREQEIDLDEYLNSLALLHPDVKAAFDYIVAYYSGLNDGSQLQTMAGRIGNWIDSNHC